MKYKYASEPWFPSNESAFTLFAAITHECNLQCLHCFAANSEKSQSVTLDDHDWFKIFDQLALLENPRLFFTGGEPLVHPSLMDFTRYASIKGIPIIIGTNATLVNNRIAKDLSAAGVAEARVSIDGSSSEMHDFLRGEGSFDKMINGIHALKDADIGVSIRTTIHKANCQYLDSIAVFLDKLNICDWEIKHLIPKGRALSHPELYTSSEEKVVALETILTIARNNSFPDMQIKLMEGVLHRDAVIPDTIKVATCPAGSKMMVVQPLGDVIPCGYLTSKVVGNITKTTLQEIRSAWHEFEEIPLPAGCINCNHKHVCKGGCPAFDFCAEEGI